MTHRRLSGLSDITIDIDADDSPALFDDDSDAQSTLGVADTGNGTPPSNASQFQNEYLAKCVHITSEPSASLIHASNLSLTTPKSAVPRGTNSGIGMGQSSGFVAPLLVGEPFESDPMARHIINVKDEIIDVDAEMSSNRLEDSSAIATWIFGREQVRNVAQESNGTARAKR